MSDEQQQGQEPQPSELEREERRLERLRLVATAWPTPDHYYYDEDLEPPPAA
jgi:hypothetical protein